MKLLHLDVETTGLDADDRICQIAYRSEDITPICVFIKPPLSIKTMAMSVNHITNKMVEDAPDFRTFLEYSDLLELVQDHVVVAHNAKFDVGMLAKEGVVIPDFIDTLKLARKVDVNEDWESYKLQYLRYFFGIEIPDAVAHDAAGDVLVLEAVFNELYKRLGEPTMSEMIEITKTPILFKKFNFGKFAGNEISKIAQVAPDYLEWLLKEKKKILNDQTDWIYTLEHYLRNV